MRKSLWSKESVPIKMTWFVCCDQILSKWSESMRNEWIEWNEVKWWIWWIWLCEPYESDLSESNGKVPMSWEWVSLSIWLDWSQWESPYVQLNECPCPYQSDLEQPYEKVPMSRERWTLWKWLEWKWKWMSLSKWSDLMRNEWIEVNRVNRGEMSELMDLTWNNPMGMVLWSSEGVPIKMTWLISMRKSLSKWSDLIE